MEAPSHMLSTVFAVFENIMSFWLELTKLSRAKVALINIVLVFVLSVPCVLGFTSWSGFQIAGKGIMDLEDFAVSNVMLPLGSLFYLIFCTSRYGWGWDKYFAEVNTGKGAALPKWLKPYLSYILPVVLVVVFIMSVL